MTRRRVAVALVPSGPLALRVDAVRTLLDDPRRFDLPTHLTLVPPVDLDDEAASGAQAALRTAASAVEPFELELGPAGTFAPRTSTLHLTVHGELDVLSQLRQSLRCEPWDRPDRHNFVPHVTLLQRAAPEQVEVGVALMGGSMGEWPVGSVHLLERVRLPEGSRWLAVAEEPLGGPRTVGRGGIELHLRTGTTIEPAAAELVGLDPTAVVPSDGVIVALAELPRSVGRPAGVAVGRAGGSGAVLDRLVVSPEHRGQGIARHVLLAWCDHAVRCGAATVIVRPAEMASGVQLDGSGEVDPDVLARAFGFTPLDATTWCRRVGPPGELGSTP